MPYAHLKNESLISEAKRLIALGWSNRIIADVLRRSYGTPVVAQCIKNIRTGGRCSPDCPQRCREAPKE